MAMSFKDWRKYYLRDSGATRPGHERDGQHLNTVIHFDFDGTLAEWRDLIPEVKERLFRAGNSLESIEDVIDMPEKLNKEIYKILNEPGYYYNLMPYENVTGFARELYLRHRDVRLLSCVISEEAMKDKDFWLEDFCPEVFGVGEDIVKNMNDKRRIYVPDEDREKKFAYIPDIRDKNKLHVLIDDHTPNLIAFEKECKKHGVNGFGIKMFNGINGKHGRWNGFTLSSDMSPVTMREEFDKADLFARLLAGEREYPGDREAYDNFLKSCLRKMEIDMDMVVRFTKRDQAALRQIEKIKEPEETEKDSLETDDYEGERE